MMCFSSEHVRLERLVLDNYLLRQETLMHVDKEVCSNCSQYHAETVFASLAVVFCKCS